MYCNFELVMSIKDTSQYLCWHHVSYWAEIILDRASLGDKSPESFGGPLFCFLVIPSLDISPLPEVVYKSSPSSLPRALYQSLAFASKASCWCSCFPSMWSWCSRQSCCLDSLITPLSQEWCHIPGHRDSCKGWTQDPGLLGTSHGIFWLEVEG